jgi:hypothetical protein
MYALEAYELEPTFMGEEFVFPRLLLRSGETPPQTEFANQTTTPHFTVKRINRWRCVLWTSFLTMSMPQSYSRRRPAKFIAAVESRSFMNRQLSSHCLVTAIVAAAVAANLAPATGCQWASIASDTRPRSGDPVTGWCGNFS